MRLTQHERDVIRSTAHEIFGPDARVCLFGSRTDDSLRGGDIDLLIDLPNPQTEARRKSLTLAARLQMRIGDQRIDVLVIDPILASMRSTASPKRTRKPYERKKDAYRRVRDDAVTRLQIPESRLPPQTAHR